MKNVFKIEKTIPIPKASKGRPSLYPWSELQVGDSFYIPHQNSPYTMLRGYNLKKSKKKQIKIRRKLEGTGQRIWRIK